MIWLLFYRYQDKAKASYTVIRTYYDKFNEDQQKMEDEKNKLEDSIQKYKERQEAKAAFGFFKCIVCIIQNCTWIVFSIISISLCR